MYNYIMDFRQEQSDGCGDHKSFTLTEYPDKKLIENIFRHPDIYKGEKKRIRKYCISAFEGGCIDIKYKKKGKYGRYYTEDNTMIASCNMWRRLRASLFANTEYDVDIKSCHFQLLINEAKPNLELDNLQELINNREDFFKSFIINDDAIKKYNEKNTTDLTKKDIIKKLLTRVLYGGLIENWYKEFDFNQNQVTIPKWYKDVFEDIKQGVNYIKSKNNLLFDAIKLDLLQEEKEKWDEKQVIECQKDKRKKPKQFNPEDYTISGTKLIAAFFQEKEATVIDATCNFIKKRFKIKPTAYCYDGFQFRKSDIEDCKLFISEINKNVDVVFEIKEFAEKLSECEPHKKTIYLDHEEFNMLPEGLPQEIYFNEYYFKIHGLNGMCYLDHTGTIKNIKNENSHFAKYLSFWELYKCSKHIREYYTIGMYPKQTLCPEKTYNMWNGFDAEKLEGDADGDIANILYHFEVVANYDTELYKYLLNYFAWLIQKPERKTNVCLLIQGKQGTGKTTLVENLLREVMGVSYVFDTCDIEKIVGKFNSSIAGKFMVILNEATGKATSGVVDKIKDSITRTQVSIEYKGLDSINVVDYCNYCYTTNNLKPVAINEDDRRFQVMECSDKYKGNVEYFNRLYADIANPKIIKTFYEFLKKREIDKFNPERDRVITEATIDLQELNKDPVEMFLEWLYSGEFEKYKLKYKLSEIYHEFKLFNGIIGYPNVCNLPVFGKILKKYKKEFEFELTKPQNVSHITFNWTTECQIDVDEVSDG